MGLVVTDVQTFLPYASFTESARVLDRQRLGKQRSENLQLLRTLFGRSDGWRNHPAVKMWRGHELTLVRYHVAICTEWVGRGYKDTCLVKANVLVPEGWTSTDPSWLGDERLHESHRANLVRKLPEHYGPLFPDVDAELPYFWPIA